jgi:hypothetical protein
VRCPGALDSVLRARLDAASRMTGYGFAAAPIVVT